MEMKFIDLSLIRLGPKGKPLPILMIQRTIVVFSTQITSCFIMQTLFNSCKDQQMDCIRSVPKGKKNVRKL